MFFFLLLFMYLIFFCFCTLVLLKAIANENNINKGLMNIENLGKIMKKTFFEYVDNKLKTKRNVGKHKFC
jgi:hypothetical protein